VVRTRGCVVEDGVAIVEGRIEDGRGRRRGSRRLKCRVLGGCRKWIEGGVVVVVRKDRMQEVVSCRVGCGSGGPSVAVGLGRPCRTVPDRFVGGFEVGSCGSLEPLEKELDKMKKGIVPTLRAGCVISGRLLLWWWSLRGIATTTTIAIRCLALSTILRRWRL